MRCCRESAGSAAVRWRVLEAVPVCEECWSGLHPQTGALCGCCGEALGLESARFVDGFGPAEGVLCAPCRMVPPMFERAVAFGLYEGELRENAAPAEV